MWIIFEVSLFVDNYYFVVLFSESNEEGKEATACPRNDCYASVISDVLFLINIALKIIIK